MKTQGDIGVYVPRTGTSSDYTVISDFQNSEEINICGLIPSRWGFVAVALGNEYRGIWGICRSQEIWRMNIDDVMISFSG